jgi:hypothetical protein
MRTARLLPIPLSYDIDRAPQLVTVATTHAALAAIQLALERAHPVLPALRLSGAGTRELSDAEHLAQLVICAANELAERLDDYAAALEGDLDDDSLLPF